MNRIKNLIKRVRGKVKRELRKKTDPLYVDFVLTKLYPSIYKKYSKLPVDEKKVVFVEFRQPKLTNSFKVLYDELYSEYDLDLHCHFLRKDHTPRTDHRNRCKEFVKDIATAKYVFLDEAMNIIGGFEMRPETVVTQLWHGCGAFKKFGLSTADSIFGSSRKEMEKYSFNRNYTNVTVSSPEVVWAYEEAMGYSRQSAVVKPLGCSRTDIFFDENFISQSYEALYEVFPEAKGKKVILYAPTFRGRVANAKAPDILDAEQLKSNFGEDYVLIIKHHPHVSTVTEIPGTCKGFAVDMTKDGLTIEELICVSDVCISDYSSLVFEYSLFERPMIFLAHDLDTYFDWRGFYYDYYELSPGPIVKDMEGLVSQLKKLEDGFDKEKVKAFKDKYMSACDGKATERIIETVMSDEARKKYKKEKPLEKKKYHLIPSFDKVGK